jgi:hypothetical protein
MNIGIGWYAQVERAADKLRMLLKEDKRVLSDGAFQSRRKVLCVKSSRHGLCADVMGADLRRRRIHLEPIAAEAAEFLYATLVPHWTYRERSEWEQDWLIDGAGVWMPDMAPAQFIVLHAAHGSDWQLAN